MLPIYVLVALMITIIFILFLFNKPNRTNIKIKFLDYQTNNNYYDEISIDLNNVIIYKGIITNNLLEVPIKGFKKKKIIYGQINIRNSKNKAEKSFKISFYKNNINNINIKINNMKQKYYYSEIIFYGDNIHSKIQINYNFNYASFNLKKRIRLIICNIDKKELRNIIERNIKDKALNKKIEKVLEKNSNQNLLINIFIGQNNSNILIFRDEKDDLIIPNKEERKLFKEFYNKINFDSINSECASLADKLFKKEKLFGKSLINKNEKDKKVIYTSFINQGINCLLENDIITKRDKNFMLGYLILLFYICNKKEANDMKIIDSLIRTIKFHGFDEIEQIKMTTAYIIFCLNYPFRFQLNFTKDLMKNDAYYEGFTFYETIIKDLKEESGIMLMFLQLNSGLGFELLNNNYCYKISMISIEDIKYNLIINIPKYFFTYSEENNDYIISEQRTQILAFNNKELFKSKAEDEYSKNNNIMNVVIGMFHESGHQKFHMNDTVGAKLSPMLYIKKDYSLGIQKDGKQRNKERGEAGKCVDNYLYGEHMNIGFLMNSNNSYKLMNKELFLGDLNKLNEIAFGIAEDYFDKYINNDSIKNDNEQFDFTTQVDNMENPSKEKCRKPFEYESIVIDGVEYPCGLNVDSCDFK